MAFSPQNNQKLRKLGRKVRFDDNDKEYVPGEKRRKKTTQKSRRNVNYPDCTKEALLKAMEQAGLPDYDAIAQIPLNIIKVKPSEVDVPPKKPSPPLSKIMQPFSDLVDWKKVNLESSDPLRNYVRNYRKEDVSFNNDDDNASSWQTASTESHHSPQQVDRLDVSPPSSGSGENTLTSNIRIVSTPNKSYRVFEDLGLSAIHNRSKENSGSKLFEKPLAAISKRNANGLLLTKSKVSAPLKAIQVKVVHGPKESLPTRSLFYECTTSKLSPVRNIATRKSTAQRKTRISEKVTVSTPLGTAQAPVVPSLWSRIETPTSSPTSVESNSSQTLKETTINNENPNYEFVTRRPSRREKSFDLCVLSKIQESFGGDNQTLCRMNSDVSASSCESQVSVLYANRGLRRSVVSLRSLPSAKYLKKRNGVDGKSSIFKKHMSTDEELKEAVNSSFMTAFHESILKYADGTKQVVSSKKKVLLLCDPDYITTFRAVLPKELLTDCKKVGEGSYGEVFECVNKDKTRFIAKIIALNPTEENEDIFAQIMPELMISFAFKKLQEAHENRAFNFINIMRASCVKGRFPQKLLEEWENYDAARGSLNENPANFPSNQLYVIMFLSNGGTDLESYHFKSAVQAFSIFKQITFSLAVAEKEYEFEHRDLHWGNVLIMPTEKTNLRYLFDSKSYSVETCGVFCSIIDFSLSRMRKDDIVIYDDLEKYADLFEGKGDYQFDIYRKMKKENCGDWQKFCPKTNVFWLHYTLLKLIETKKYRSKAKLHTEALHKLKALSKNILQYNSASEFLCESGVLDI